MLPQQSTGLLRRKGATRFYMWLVFSHTPLALFWRLAVLPHGVTAHQRAECEGFDLTVSPSGALRRRQLSFSFLRFPVVISEHHKRRCDYHRVAHETEHVRDLIQHHKPNERREDYLRIIVD